MANYKISQLPSSSALTSDDFLPIVDSGTLTTQRATAQQVLDYITGSTFNSLTVTTLTASNLSGSDTLQFATISASVISASSYVGIAGGSEKSIQFNSGSQLSGSENLTYDYDLDLLSATTASFGILRTDNVGLGPEDGTYGALLYSDIQTKNITGSYDTLNFNYDTSVLSGVTAEFTTITGSTVTGTLAKFTTISSSNSVVSGNFVLQGQADLAAYPDYAYIIYTSSYDKLVIFPGLYVSGSLTGSGNAKFNEVSGTIAQFSEISASVISASSYVGLPVATEVTPGGTNQSIQFNSGSTFSGSANFVWDYENEQLAVGKTTSNAKLDVNGDTIVTGTLTVTGSQILVINDDESLLTVSSTGGEDPQVSLYASPSFGDTGLQFFNGSTGTSSIGRGGEGTGGDLVFTNWNNVIVDNDTNNIQNIIFRGYNNLDGFFYKPSSAPTTAGPFYAGFAASVALGDTTETGSLFLIDNKSYEANSLRIKNAGVEVLRVEKTGNTFISGNLSVTGSLTGSVSFTANDPALWATSPPITIQDAINRIAAAVFSGNTGLIA